MESGSLWLIQFRQAESFLSNSPVLEETSSKADRADIFWRVANEFGRRLRSDDAPEGIELNRRLLANDAVARSDEAPRGCMRLMSIIIPRVDVRIRW